MKHLLITAIALIVSASASAQVKDTSDIYEKHFRLLKKYRALRDSIDSVKFTVLGLTSQVITSPCRDTVIIHKEKVAVLIILDFKTSKFAWKSAYRTCTEKTLTGKNCIFIGQSNTSYVFTDLKGTIINNIIDYRFIR